MRERGLKPIMQAIKEIEKKSLLMRERGLKPFPIRRRSGTQKSLLMRERGLKQDIHLLNQQV